MKKITFFIISLFCISIFAQNNENNLLESVDWSGLFDGSNNGTNSTVYAVAVSGGNVYVGGSFQMAGGKPANNIARWDGSTWSALGSGTSSTVFGLAVSGSDVYAVGSFNTAGGISARGIAKWNGTSWYALGGGVYNDAKCVTVSGSDVYVGGAFTSASNDGSNFITVNNIAKWNGTSWSALGTGVSGPTGGIVYSMAFANNMLYVGGYITSAGGNSVSCVAKWDGSNWSALGSGVDNVVYGLVMSGTDLFVCGAFSNAGGNTASKIAKWNGSNWSALGSGLLYSTCYSLSMVGNELFAGGDFTTAGGTSASRIAKWDGTSWSAIGSGVNSTVRGFAKSGGVLYVGGSFTTAGGYSANYIAQLGGASSAAAGVGQLISGGGGTVSFNNESNTTAVSINLASGAGSGQVNVLRYDDAPFVPSENIIGNVSNYRWIIESTSLASSFTGTVRFKVSDIPNSGINDPTKVTVYSRPTPGSGSFTALTTNYDSDNGEIVANVTSFSEFAFGSSENPLPVELTSFTASVAESKVILNWQTATEVNNYGFEVQRSVNVADDNWKLNAESWKKVGFVEGHGNSNSIKEYSFTDDISEHLSLYHCSDPSGNLYLTLPKELTLCYRLKQIDIDGKFSYSNEIIVETLHATSLPSKYTLYQNYPNPFNPVTKIRYSITSNVRSETSNKVTTAGTSVKLIVFDILGNEVATLVNE
ncbi:MAG TPA: hypothetical protein PK397_05150, partial [Ignavibacteriaceae bacterium]|nr:hypothetical protein [Ignavibacteriaceae bacterium]